MLQSVIPTQNSLRDVDQLPEMIAFVRQCGTFNQETLSFFAKNKGTKVSPLIKIVRFEDNRYFLHDGHHRATAIWLGGRETFRIDEFIIEDWKYQDYLEINLEQKWYTPFDPRKEVRINHILPYKGLVEEFLKKKIKPSKEEVRRFILDHYEAKSYTEPRSANSIVELARNITPLIIAGVE